MELFEKVNALGIGAQGLGGDHGVGRQGQRLSDPRSQQARGNHSKLQLRGTCISRWMDRGRTIHSTGLSEWPDIEFELGDDVKRVNLDTLTPEETQSGSPAIRCCSRARCLLAAMRPQSSST